MTVRVISELYFNRTFRMMFSLSFVGGGGGRGEGFHSSISASGYGPEGPNLGGPNLGGPNPLGHRNI